MTAEARSARPRLFTVLPSARHRSGVGFVSCIYHFERISIALAGLLVTVTATVVAQRGTAPASNSADVTTRIVASAQAVLGTLDESGRAKVQFPFDGPQKTRWSNLPGPMFQRTGLRLGDLTAPQRAAVMTLLSVALSRDGYRKVTDIMRGDEVLRKTAGSGPPRGGGERCREPRRIPAARPAGAVAALAEAWSSVRMSTTSRLSARRR